MPSSVDTSPGRHPWPSSAISILFRESPSHYEIVKPERLAEWEAQLAETLGLKAKRYRGADFASWLETTSFCGSKPDGHPNACDSDIIGAAVMAKDVSGSRGNDNLLDWPPEGVPIVFHKQPDEYEVMPPARFTEWEAHLRENANLDVKVAANANYLPTISWCGPKGPGTACDSDTIPG